MPARSRRKGTFPLNEEAWEALKEAAEAVAYDLSDDTVYELRLRLRTPAIFALYKADIPTPGLPTLDGFLKFLAFRWAVDKAIRTRPELTNEVLWQWNVVLREPNRWIEFPIPIREEKLSDKVVLYDCSIGLPVNDGGEILYPAGAFFFCAGNFVTYPSETDQIALRRRSVEPFYRPLELSGELKTSLGSTKALDHRIYYALTREYVFYFRGDRKGVEQLLDFAVQHDIGIGKKTTLGYGRLAEYSVMPTKQRATLGHRIEVPGLTQIALLKNVPYYEMQRRCMPAKSLFPSEKRREEFRKENERLFGAPELRLASPIEAFDCFRPPYWRREGRTQVLRYGSLLIPRE